MDKFNPDAHSKPSPQQWSLNEFFCHLDNEEREDFKARTEVCLSNLKEFAPIDPVAWVKDRNYGAREFTRSSEDFSGKRVNSILWLRSLAHDLLHFRQILKLEYARLKIWANHSLEYAGNW